jgi:hypothetical protein
MYDLGKINWDGVEQILNHGLDCMRADKTQYPILFAESFFATLEDKAKVFLYFQSN